MLALLGLLLAGGVAHRLVAPLAAAGFAYVFLLEQAEYLNHFYAALLLLVLLAIMPADRALSFRAWRHPEHPRSVPLWSIWMLRFQVGVVYAYAGIAKLGRDWVDGEPIGSWLAERSDLFLIGGLLGASSAGQIFAIGGLIFDLSIVPLLLWERTRSYAYAAAVCFHITNWIIFDIGIFPPMMIVATTIFFAPAWPRSALESIRSAFGRGRIPATAPPEAAPSGATVPAASAAETAAGRRIALPLTLLLSAWIAVQLLVPLRHHLYPGLVHWSEEGHRFSWQMKLRQKDGVVAFFARDVESGATERIDLEGIVTRRQMRIAATFPDMIVQLAEHLAERERERGREVEILVASAVSLNGRPPAPLVDPEADLSSVGRGIGHAEWIEAGPGGPPGPRREVSLPDLSSPAALPPG